MLEHLFGSKTRLKLLQIFFHSPQHSFFLRELSRMAEVQLNAVRREIANLEKIGIAVRAAGKETNEDGAGTERSKYYQLQSGSMLYPELKALLLKARLMEEREFVEEIKQKGGTIKLFLLTGIFVEGSKAETDILLVGKIKPVAVARLVKNFEKTLGKTIRYTLLEEKEFKERREIGDIFLYNIFESKHVVAVDDYRVT